MNRKQSEQAAQAERDAAQERFEQQVLLRLQELEEKLERLLTELAGRIGVTIE